MMKVDDTDKDAIHKLILKKTFQQGQSQGRSRASLIEILRTSSLITPLQLG